MELLTYLLKSAAILFLFYAVYRFALKSDTFFVANRLYLLSGTLAAICLPALTFTTVTYIEAPVIEAGTALNLVPQLQQTLQPGPVSVPWWQPVLFVYFAGVTVFLLRFFVQLFSLLRLLQKNTAEKMGRYRYIKVKGTLSPFSFFNHIVYNPAQHTPEELEMIVSHEKVHARQWHSVDLLLVNLLRALQWPSPIAWLYKKSTVENLEFIADSKTIQHVASPTKYQLALVKASSTCNAPALTNSFYNPFARLSVLGSKITVPGHIGHIKKRIIMLNKTNSHRNNRLKLLAILPLLAVFMWGFQVEEKTGHIEPATEKTITGTLQTNGPGPTAEGTLPQKAQQPAPGENTQVKPRATAKARTKTVPATKHTGNGNTPPVLFKVAPTFAGAKKSTLAQKRQAASIKEIKIKFTKNTTKEDLDRIKKDLKSEHGIAFNYKNVDFNNNGEITSISISYSGHGMNGNYSINDKRPIEDFYLYIDTENGKSSIGNLHGNDQRYAIVHREHLGTARKNLAKARKEMQRDRIKIRKKLLKENMETRKEHLRKAVKIRSTARAHNHDSIHLLHDKILPHRGSPMAKAHMHKRSLLAEAHNASKERITITKNTTDAALKKTKQRLSEKGIDFGYKRVKRNSRGEITGIKVTVNNNDGNQVTRAVKGSNSKPIDKIVIRL